jgi:isocitrate/isopropylmalate dehydrogenase
MNKRIAVIPGEDAAPEAMDAAVDLIDRLQLGIDWTYPLVGLPAQAKGLSTFPAEARGEIDAADATYFGASSGPSARALIYLRWGKKTYANVRPTRWAPGYATPLHSPEGLDFVIVRENLEDSYVSLEGDLADLAPLDLTSPMSRTKAHELGAGRYALKAITEEGSERIIRFAFELARKRKAAGHPGKLTASSKWNMLPKTDGLFIEIARRVAGDYEDIAFETLIVDDFAHRLVLDPHRFDVIVLPNLYGDILSDAAAGLAGGLGLAPSGCYGEDYAYFESAHGTAPDIAGKGVINPTATLLSGAMMLGHLGFDDAAGRLRVAIDKIYAQGRTLTPDQGGSASTKAFCDAVYGEL